MRVTEKILNAWSSVEVNFRLFLTKFTSISQTSEVSEEILFNKNYDELEWLFKLRKIKFHESQMLCTRLVMMEF